MGLASAEIRLRQVFFFDFARPWSILKQTK
jgi:hypothetical protein